MVSARLPMGVALLVGFRSRCFPCVVFPGELAGPEIVYFGGLNGHLLPQNPLEKVGGEAPQLLKRVLR